MGRKKGGKKAQATASSSSVPATTTQQEPIRQAPQAVAEPSTSQTEFPSLGGQGRGKTRGRGKGPSDEPLPRPGVPPPAQARGGPQVLSQTHSTFEEQRAVQQMPITQQTQMHQQITQHPQMRPQIPPHIRSQNPQFNQPKHFYQQPFQIPTQMQQQMPLQGQPRQQMPPQVIQQATRGVRPAAQQSFSQPSIAPTSGPQQQGAPRPQLPSGQGASQQRVSASGTGPPHACGKKPNLPQQFPKTSATQVGPTPTVRQPRKQQRQVPTSVQAAEITQATQGISQIHLGAGEPNIAAKSSSSTQLVKQEAKGMELPTRKNRNSAGTIGRHITVRTNFMPLNLKNICKTAIHYDITFDPDKPKRFLKIAFNKFCTVYFPQRYPAFDGVKNVYASEPLKGVGYQSLTGEVKIINPDNELEKEYKITIKYASTVDMTSLSRYMTNGTSIDTPQEALQCIDIVFRHALSKQFVQVGKSFFTPPSGRVVSLGDGMDLWYGLFSSCVLGWKPYLNVDIAHKGFPTKQLVTQYMEREKNIDLRKPVPPYALDEVRKFIKTLKVMYEIPGKPGTKRSFRVNDVCVKSAEDESFVDEKNKRTTVVRYYKETKGYNIIYPKLPCLWVGSRNKKVYIPPELCTIQEGQVVIKKLTELQTRNMIKQAATPTDFREKKIMDAYNNSTIENHPVVKEFKLQIDSRFEKVAARVLEPPSLQYSQNTVTPREGVWRPDREKFLKAATLQNWTVLNLDHRTRSDKLEYFCSEIMKFALQVGINIKPAKPPVTLDNRRLQKELPDFFSKAKQDKVELVFVVIMPGDTYARVKQVAELQYGILTQCITSNTMYKLNPSTINNILLKVNAKLNGTNYQISSRGLRRPTVLNTPVMIVGADVTHPSPDQTDIPSVVGVAASHDPNAFKYNMIWRLQLPKIEIIEDLQTIMREHLMKFYKETHYKPNAIYFFRDGVSEGQFKQVLNSEFTAIRRACQSLEQTYKPPITMLVVQKRHHTRFFPSDKDAVGKNKNVPPGTVVDTQITHPTEMDFYLVSHQSIQGVARPTKYRVLWDDNNLTEDQLHELTYFLCHMFSRCTRAVSYPTPTYYAHLAAYRGRVYIEGHQIQLDDLQREQQSHQIQDSVQKSRPMFFV